MSEPVEILGQSQPRLSRHLRLLVEAGLPRRHREGNRADYRLNEAPGNGELCPRLLAEGVTAFHFYTLNQAPLRTAVCRMLGAQPALEEAA